MDNPIDFPYFNDMANQAADQALLLLGLDRISSNNLINEIKTEEDLKVKYSKLLHILIDRLTIMSKSYCDFPMECKQCIQTVREIFQKSNFQEPEEIQIPNSPKEFLYWIPNQFNLFTSLIKKIQNKLNLSEQQIDRICSMQLDRESKFKEEKMELKRGNDALNDKIQSLKDRLQTCETEKQKLNEINRRTKLEMNKQTQQLEKSLLAEAELSALRNQYDELRSQMEDLKQTLTKPPFQVKLLNQKYQDSQESLKRAKQLNKQLSDQLKAQTEELDNEKLMNYKRERKFNKMKKHLSNYANELLIKEKELNDLDAQDSIKQNLRLQIQSLSAQLVSTKKERDSLQAKLSNEYHNNEILTSENETLKAQCSILQNENINYKKDNSNLEKSIKKVETDGIHLNNQLQRNDLQRFSIENQLKESELKRKQLEETLASLTQKVTCQTKTIVRLESNLMKTKDQLNDAHSQLCVTGSDQLSLQKVGFLLADALCQKYNPKNTRSEVERLIQIAHLEHIKLSETERVKINPFDMPIYDSKKENSSYKQIHSKFDDLDKELVHLTTQHCNNT